MKPIVSRQLAWELADQLRRRMTDKERMAVFLDLGSGEEVAAIHRLITIAAEHHHALPAHMSKQLRVWAHTHDVQERYAPALARIESASFREVGLAAVRLRLRETC